MSKGFDHWICGECKHEIHAVSQPVMIKWSDGHNCVFHLFKGNPEKMKEISKAMSEWYDSCGDDMFVDDLGKRDFSLTFTGSELASVAADFLSGEASEYYFLLNDKERNKVKSDAFPDDCYRY